MKNITIILLLIVFGASIIYSYIKADEAEKSRIEAVMHRNETIELQKQADILHEQLIQAVAEAKRQAALSMEVKTLLDECQNK